MKKKYAPTARALCLPVLAGIAAVPLFATRAGAQTAPPAVAPPAQRDGQHDFDFEAGSWKIHLKRLLHSLTRSTTWVEFDGTTVTCKVCDGKARLEEFETSGPSLYWGNSKDGSLAGPPMSANSRTAAASFIASTPSTAEWS
jgi:hypothetical protein